MKKILFGLFSLSILLVACSKSSSSSNQASIVGNWTLVNTIDSITPVSGPIVKDTTVAQPNEYIHITSSNAYVNMYKSSSSTYQLDTLTYQINGSTLIAHNIDSAAGAGIDTLTIQTLTNTNLTLSLSNSSVFGSEITWLNLTR
jgi:hypothetical protein